MKIDNDIYGKLTDIQKGEVNDAYQKAIRLLNFAPQMEKSIRVKLSKKGFSQFSINLVIDSLTEDKFLNDLENAAIYADNLVKNKFIGLNKVVSKLIVKGLNKEKALELSKEIINNNGGEEEIIKKYIEKNEPVFQRYLKNNKKQNIVKNIYNSGFKLNLIEKNLREYNYF